MAPGNKNTLLTLPSEIIYDVCDYLYNDDISSLQLVCTVLSSKIPPGRLEEIRSQRTIFKHPYELTRLERLASLPLEKRSRIKHIIINLADPNLVPVSSYDFDKLIERYPEQTRLKILKFYHNYRKQNPHEFGDKYSKAFKRLTRRLVQAGFISKASISDEAGAATETEPETIGEDDLSFARRSEIYSILSTNFPWGSGPHPSRFTKAKDAEAMHYDFFKTLISTLKLLPNLRILDFRDKALKEQNTNQAPRIWKTFNPALAKFLKENPEVEDLPWQEWFQNSSYYQYGLTLAYTYPGVLFCAAFAGCQISEIRLDGKGVSRGLDSVPTWAFRRWQYEAARLSCRPRGSVEENDKADLAAFKHTYGNLNRLEICLDVDWVENHLNDPEIPVLLMALIRDVQILVVKRILEVNTGDSSFRPSFLVPQLAVLPRLRRFEVKNAGIGIKALTEFLIGNKGSLKEVVCTLTLYDTTTRPDMIEFLGKLREALDLEVFTMDFMTHRDPMKICNLSVDIRGKQRDDSACVYRFGTRCEPGRYWTWYSHHERKALTRPHWVTKRSWEEFIEGMEEIDTVDPCEEHWDGVSTGIGPT